MTMMSHGKQLCLLVLSLLCMSIQTTTSPSSTVTVNTSFGAIKGLKQTDEASGKDHVIFRGIPYAKAPVGELRFAKPLPHQKLDGVFDASDINKWIMCPHPDQMTLGFTDFSEDCLVLSIHLKDGVDTSKPLKKVMVFIHGGGFIIGAGAFYNPTTLIVEEDIIMVTVNYRLGLLGFLSTEDEASPGNYGLWDQRMALKWVKENIRSFGGDPDDVMIAGESAGGFSVGYQCISPQTKGLFTKAYPQSGTGTAAFAKSKKSRKDTLTFAKLVGCWDKEAEQKTTLQENTDVIECLRKLPTSDFTWYFELSLSYAKFMPRVDGDFIPDDPLKLINDDDYLDAIGFFDRTYIVGVDQNEQGLIDNFATNLKGFIMMNNETTQEQKEAIINKLNSNTIDNYIEARLGSVGASDKIMVDEILDFYDRRFVNNTAVVIPTDLNFLIPTIDYLRACSRRESCQAYFLYFNHFPRFLRGRYRGTFHGIDLIYWFDIPLPEVEKLLQIGIAGDLDKKDLELKRLFSSMIGKFIREGNPNTDALKAFVPSGWLKYDSNRPSYLSFSSNPWIGYDLEKDKMDLWFNTVPEYKDKDEEEHIQHNEL